MEVLVYGVEIIRRWETDTLVLLWLFLGGGERMRMNVF